jgi:hypothetical protein
MAESRIVFTDVLRLYIWRAMSQFEVKDMKTTDHIRRKSAPTSQPCTDLFCKLVQFRL